MASRRKYRKQYLRWHSTYEKRATKLLKRTFRKWVNAIDYEHIDNDNYIEWVSRAVDLQSLTDTYIDIYKNIGIVHGKRVGKAINLELKAFSLGAFLTLFERAVSNYLFEFGMNRIVSIRDTFFDEMIEMFRTTIRARKRY